jgi:hypothetical protein
MKKASRHFSKIRPKRSRRSAFRYRRSFVGGSQLNRHLRAFTPGAFRLLNGQIVTPKVSINFTAGKEESDGS